MAVSDFYLRGKKSFSLAYFNHGTSQADGMQALVEDWGNKNSIEVNVGKISSTTKPAHLSPEEYWRNERYAFFHSITNERPIITCHHLGDALEGYIFSTLHGNPKIIKHTTKTPAGDIVLRPFLTTAKKDMIDWCISHNVKWFEDVSNKDVSTPRNRIRHNILKEALMINPGLDKMIRKKVLAQ